jgi:hypothetical protein
VQRHSAVDWYVYCNRLTSRYSSFKKLLSIKNGFPPFFFIQIKNSGFSFVCCFFFSLQKSRKKCRCAVQQQRGKNQLWRNHPLADLNNTRSNSIRRQRRR